MSVKGIEWDTKQLQQAGELIQFMDVQRIRDCENLNRAATTQEYGDYLKTLSRVEDSAEKLQQLAALVASNNPRAVDKWIETYLPNSAVSPDGPRNRHQLHSGERIPDIGTVPFHSFFE